LLALLSITGRKVKWVAQTIAKKGIKEHACFKPFGRGSTKVRCLKIDFDRRMGKRSPHRKQSVKKRKKLLPGIFGDETFLGQEKDPRVDRFNCLPACGRAKEGAWEEKK